MGRIIGTGVCCVARGELYRCKARRGWTTVKVTDICERGPWVTVVRVDADGDTLRGRFTTGPLENCRRGDSFAVYLSNHGDGTPRMRMPRGYEACGVAVKRRKRSPAGIIRACTTIDELNEACRAFTALPEDEKPALRAAYAKRVAQIRSPLTAVKRVPRMTSTPKEKRR